MDNSSEVKKLLDKGANLNIQNKDGNSALMLTCKWRNMKLVAAILSKTNVNRNLKNKDGFTALDIAKNGLEEDNQENFLEVIQDNNLNSQVVDQLNNLNEASNKDLLDCIANEI